MAKLITLVEGVENFKENKKLIKNGDYKRTSPIQQRSLLEDKGPHYHGPDVPGHLLVKLRKEAIVRVAKDGTYHDHHSLDIYTCLKCSPQVECLRSGYEIGWWNGTDSRKLT